MTPHWGAKDKHDSSSPPQREKKPTDKPQPATGILEIISSASASSESQTVVTHALKSKVGHSCTTSGTKQKKSGLLQIQAIGLLNSKFNLATSTLLLNWTESTLNWLKVYTVVMNWTHFIIDELWNELNQHWTKLNWI